MKRIGEIDILGKERPSLSNAQRKNLLQARLQQEREEGYKQLTELCNLGEYDAAKHLAQQNPQWGYQVIDKAITFDL